ncbi:MAG: hypothetical protein ACI9KE_000084 [Polyangiales bacterium]|jgi:hypothetical protein
MRNASLWFGVLVLVGCAENGGGIGVSSANLSHAESSRYEEVRAQATPEARVRGMAELANELTNERARADGLLGREADINTGRDIEERYRAMREAMMNDLAEDQEEMLARLEPEEPAAEFRSHEAREAVAQESQQEVMRALRESGASEADVQRMFAPPAHLPTPDQLEEMRQDAIQHAAELSERQATGRPADLVWPPRRGER